MVIMILMAVMAMTTLSEDKNPMTSMEAKETMSSMDFNQTKVTFLSAILNIQTSKLTVEKEMTQFSE